MSVEAKIARNTKIGNTCFPNTTVMCLIMFYTQNCSFGFGLSNGVSIHFRPKLIMV